LNYRHAFHAGGPADVVKHAVLTLLLQALAAGGRPFSLIDTHAGVGAYDLAGPEAARTGEWRQGIGRLLQAPSPPPEAARYLEIVRAAGAPATYPGSPAIARAMMGPEDRLILVEKHPEDGARLKARFRGDLAVAVHLRDGWEAVGALTPPSPRRGLLFIDPPFEEPGELGRMVAAVATARRRWPTARIALWYPLKARGEADRFLGEVAALAGRPTLAAELAVGAVAEDGPLAAAGLALIDPPWRLPEALGRLLPALHAILAQGGGWRLEWLAR
jgi:23S rRNA (adenine2030-N6)-methyltransferase